MTATFENEIFALTIYDLVYLYSQAKLARPAIKSRYLYLFCKLTIYIVIFQLMWNRIKTRMQNSISSRLVN